MMKLAKKRMNLLAFLCLISLIAPAAGTAAGGKHPLKLDAGNIGRTLQASERIAYGQAAYKGQFPFMARIGRVSTVYYFFKSYSHNCGGTVIAPDYILTAAHCLFDKSKKYTPPTTVFLGGVNIGSFNLNDFPEQIGVAEVKYPPQYNPFDDESHYDIAILRLETPTSYPAVTLASKDPPVDTYLTSIGWGVTENSENLSDFLLYTTLKVGKFGDQCPVCPQNPCTIICEVGIPQPNGGYTNACPGDSGGPQILPGTTTQVSVVSFGPSECGVYSYSASTSVATMRSWIDSIVGSNTPTPTPTPIPVSASISTITYTSRYSTLLMTYDMCTCGASRVWGAGKGNGGKPESQTWSFTRASSSDRYYIKAEVIRSCSGASLYLTSPELAYDEYPDGVLQVPYLAEQGPRQEWILQTTRGSTSIRSASRSDSRDFYSYLGMSIDPLDDMFMVPNIEASDYTFTISAYKEPFEPSCSTPVPSPTPTPTPIPSPSPTPVPVPSPSPSPSPSPTLVPVPVPSPSPRPKPKPSPPSRRRPPPPRRKRPPPPRGSKAPPPPRRKPPPPRFSFPPIESSPAQLPSPPPFLTPSPPAQFVSPGIDFSLLIPGFNTIADFGTAQQSALCGAITNGWTSGASCTVGSVSFFSTGTASLLIVSGYAHFTFSAVPTLIQLQAATAQRDARVAALTTNINSVLGGLFPGAVPNCACSLFATVKTSGTASFTYDTTISGVPGPMQCGAKLTYDTNNPNAIISQVGVDDGAFIPSNLGKYCSTPPVNGGVAGIPGSGFCRQYGVIAVTATTGKLCSLAPIASLPDLIAYPTPIPVTVEGLCKPLGLNRLLNQVCSLPAAPGGVYESINTRNCNVQTSFIPQPGSTTSSTCGILPQGFVITVAS